MSRPPVKPPPPREERVLPWVAIAAGSALGLVVFMLLWQVAVELQQERAPKAPDQTWRAAP